MPRECQENERQCSCSLLLEEAYVVSLKPRNAPTATNIRSAAGQAKARIFKCGTARAYTAASGRNTADSKNRALPTLQPAKHYLMPCNTSFTLKHGAELNIVIYILYMECVNAGPSLVLCRCWLQRLYLHNGCTVAVQVAQWRMKTLHAPPWCCSTGTCNPGLIKQHWHVQLQVSCHTLASIMQNGTAC